MAILLARHARRDEVVFPPQLPIFVETSRTERNETETERNETERRNYKGDFLKTTHKKYSKNPSFFYFWGF